MRFAEATWLWGILLAVAVALVLAWGGIRHQRAVRRFGDPKLVTALKTSRTGVRRAVRGVLLVLALCLAFVAAAQPQYGQGTRLIPATNLDVVIVLDFSKSMYARDVSPSRIARAKVEVSQLIRELPGARFGGVAFAGTPMSFPLTSDGAALAQFFRGLEPNDMPVGGTAIARALNSARELLERDPRSAKHERVVVLITDGEDLEGDPVAVAEALAKARVTVHVVQIGGRAPEPIPDVDEHGQVRGLRHDASGRLLMTSLSADGEAQLAQIASAASGKLVRAEKGSTGVVEITRELRRLMTDELSERVETVYADVYAYPLSLAVLLLVLEAWIGTAPRRKPPAEEPPSPPKRRRRPGRSRIGASAWTTALLALNLLGCERVDGVLDGVFQRYSPVVDEAIAAFERKEHERGVELLVEYLETGPCEAGVLGTPERARSRPDASFDLALGLYALGERSGGNSDEPPGGTKPAPSEELRSQVECALRLLGPLALDTSLPLALRARAHYLTGNLELLRENYRAAVAAYDAALRLIPGLPETEDGTNDGIGRDAAHNRAIALRRLEEQPPEDQQSQASSDDQDQNSDPEDSEQQQPDEQQGQQDQNQDDQDQGQGQDQDQNQDPNQDQDQQASNDDQGSGQDDSRQSEPEPSDAPSPSDRDDTGAQEQPNAPERAASAVDPSQQRDERILDELERAPTFQQQDARRDGRRIPARGSMEDK